MEEDTNLKVRGKRERGTVKDKSAVLSCKDRMRSTCSAISRLIETACGIRNKYRPFLREQDES